MRAYIIAITLIALLFGTIGTLFYRNMSAMAQSAGPPPPVTIETAIANSSDWPQRLMAVGTLRARRGVALSSEVSAAVTGIHVTSGQQVAANQLLFTLNDSAERANVKQQEANVALAELQFKRDAKLLPKRSVSQTQYDQSKAALDAAKAQLQQAKAQLHKKRLHSPFAGTVGIIDINVGDYIDAGTVITQLENLAVLDVDFTVPTRYFARLRLGQALTLFGDDGNMLASAQLSAIDSRADTNTGTLAARATLNENPGLLPGTFVRLSIALSEPQRHVQVPNTAISYSLHGDTVYIVEKDDSGSLRVKPVIVKTGASRDSYTAVLSGINEGQQVVIAGQNKLYPGAAVTIASESRVAIESNAP